MSQPDFPTQLRQAGLKVTSARLAALKITPALLERHGHLAPLDLLEAATSHGYKMSFTTAYRLIPTLVDAGLLPAHAVLDPHPVSQQDPDRISLEKRIAMQISDAGVRVTPLRIAALCCSLEMKSSASEIHVPELFSRMKVQGYRISRRGLYKLWHVLDRACPEFCVRGIA